MVFLLLPLCPWVFNEKTVKAAQDFEDASVMDECGTLMPLFEAVFFDLNVGGNGTYVALGFCRLKQ